MLWFSYLRILVESGRSHIRYVLIDPVFGQSRLFIFAGLLPLDKLAGVFLQGVFGLVLIAFVFARGQGLERDDFWRYYFGGFSWLHRDVAVIRYIWRH